MARDPRELTLEYTAQSLADLARIWEWNAEQRGVDVADRYIAYLKAGTLKLTRSSAPGRPVPDHGAFRYAVIRRRRKGIGHLVVFIANEQVLRVYRYFHTSQNWQSQIAREPL